MASQNTSSRNPVGVIGAGSFGTVIANLLAENNDKVYLYARREGVLRKINEKGKNKKQKVHSAVIPTTDIEQICAECSLIFPSVPSANFREMMKAFSPYLRPDHILIHCTKGFDVRFTDEELLDTSLKIKPKDIFTMSEVILQESNVLRIGCLSGPNLSGEIANHQPAATVIASRFDEVIKEGQFAIRSKRFQVYGSHDILSVELSGVLKNTMAIAAGGLSGLGFGQNALSFLISRGLSEIIRLGDALGATKESFLGLAGIGDLIATCTSPLSRNYTVGYRLAKGESLKDILDTSEEVAEGIKTVSICKKMGDSLGIRLPIITVIYKVLFEEMKAEEGLGLLMEYRWGTDIDFM